MPVVSVHFEENPRVRSVRQEIILGLKSGVSIKETTEGDECDVKVFFCPIVSRAGTDINAVLSRVKADKPTIVVVLQHTFEKQAVVPSCREYERERLILVTFLFSEDQGLLQCQSNVEAFNKATGYLKRWALVKENKQDKDESRIQILPLTLGIVGVVIFVCWRWYHRAGRPFF